MFDTSSTGWQVLTDGSVHVLNEDRDGKIMPTTLCITEVEDKFLDELNITFQWRLLTVLNHTLGEKITLPNINQNMHIGRNLLQNGVSVSIDDPGVASVDLCSSSCDESRENDCNWRNGGTCGGHGGCDCGRLLICFLSACCFFKCWCAHTYPSYVV